MGWAELLKHPALLPLGISLPLAVACTRGPSAVSVASAVGIISALVSVAAGVAFLVCWKMGGRATPGWLGVGLVNLGLLSAACHSLSNLTIRSFEAAEPLGRVVVAVAAVAALFAALRTPPVDAGFRPARALGVSAMAGLGLVLVLGRLTPVHPSVVTRAGLSVVTAGFCAALWLCLAAWGRFGGGAERALGAWLGAFALARGAASVIIAALPASGRAAVGAQMLTLWAATMALLAGTGALRWRVHGQNRYAYDLRTVLDRLRTEVEYERAELEERLHDLRNAVAAVRTADSTLRRFGGRLDEATRVSLADALSAELSRLQSLIEPGRRACMEDFDLATALRPVVATDRALGSTVETAIGPLMVRADAVGLAQVVQNLLVNARLYAPGAPVRVAAERLGDRVILHVSDSGPGVADDERTAIFARGGRGRTSRGTGGSGLGLYVAARLMAEMGGSLHLGGGEGGAHFVIELQAATEAPRYRDTGDVRVSRPGRGLAVVHPVP